MQAASKCLRVMRSRFDFTEGKVRYWLERRARGSSLTLNSQTEESRAHDGGYTKESWEARSKGRFGNVFSIAEERPDDHGTQSRPMESENRMRVELNSLIDEASITTVVRCSFLQ